MSFGGDVTFSDESLNISLIVVLEVSSLTG